jgi:hypothetical protein
MGAILRFNPPLLKIYGDGPFGNSLEYDLTK